MTHADTRPKWIVFDAVGTLFYADPPVAEAYAKIGGRFGLTVAPDDLQGRFGDALRTIVSSDALDEASERETWRRRVRYVFQHAPAEVFDDLFDALWNWFADPRAWALYGDVPAALDEAAKNARPAVASNFDGRLIPLVNALLPGRFEHVLPASRLGAAKPDPAFFRRVEKILGASGKELRLIGDDPDDDGEGARKAGWNVRLVTADPLQRRIDSPGSLLAAVR